MTEIKTLLPQREPFLFVDALLSADRNQIIGIKKYEQGFPFCRDISPGRAVVPETILVESLVQCGGAGLASMGLTGQSLWGLATLEKVRWQAVVEPPATVTMHISTLKISARILRQSGTGFCDGNPVLTATWCCLKLR